LITFLDLLHLSPPSPPTQTKQTQRYFVLTWTVSESSAI